MTRPYAWRISITLVLLVGLFFPAARFGGATSASQQEQSKQNSSTSQVVVSDPVIPQLTRAVRDLPQGLIEFGSGQDINPRRTYDRGAAPAVEGVAGVDPLLKQRSGVSAPGAGEGFETPLINIAGQNYTGVNPPDTVGDVGPNHYIQMVNSGGGASVTIYNKSGTLIFGPFMLDTLGVGGACASGFGDPIVLYDRQADRWMMAEFAGSGNHLCVYISTTPDPTGTYNRYDFSTPNFPDYPKYAVWWDAYYVSSNENDPAAYALDRTKMLAGLPATSQRFTAPPLSGFPFQALTPSDIDSVLQPPAGSPNYFMRHRDTEVHGPAGFPTQDILEIFEFHVDWVTPANSTFTGPITIFTSEFDSDLCGLSSFNCFPQPGTSTTLDPLREVIMWRLQYRSFGSYETLVGNFVTDVDGTDHGGVRWFELRKAGAGSWALYQEGTVAPDIHNRWMGAISMDGSGNIALGYNVSSTSVFPSLRYIGRLSSDPIGAMPQGEYNLVAGSASNGSNRYGDYSAMSVDPADDCTFWFTGEYNQSSTWSTRIGVFKFDTCSGGLGPDFQLSVAPEAQAICAPADATYTVDVTPSFGFSDPVTFSAVFTPTAPLTTGFSVNPVFPPGSTQLTVGNTAAAGEGRYTIDITGAAPTVTHDITASLEIYQGLPAAPLLLTPMDGASSLPVQPTFTWQAAQLPSTYDIQIALDADFTQIVDSASGLSQPTYTVGTPLDTAERYYWRVRVNDLCGAGEFSTPFMFSTEVLPTDCPVDYSPLPIYQQDFENDASSWSHSGVGDTWDRSQTRANSGAWSMHALNPASVSDQILNSPVITLPVGLSPLTLQFWNYQSLQDIQTGGGCYDGSLLEVSTDSGATWQQIDSELQTDPYDGPISTLFGNPLGDRNAWCGDPQPWLNSVVDVNALAGENTQFRFRLGSDSSSGREGWYIDDVLVQGCVKDAYVAAWGAPSLKDALPGDTITHTFTLQNLGYGDTYTLTVTGAAWDTTLLGATTLSLGSGQSADVSVQVHVPAAPGEAIIASDSFTLTATSQAMPAAAVNVTGTTNAIASPTLSLNADSLAKIAAPGANVDYMLEVTNIGAYTDTFSVQASGVWTATLNASTVGPLAPGETASLTLTVDVPADASLGQSDQTIFTATSALDPAIFASLELTTSAEYQRLFLPIIERH